LVIALGKDKGHRVPEDSNTLIDFSFLNGVQPPGTGGVDNVNREQARRFSGARVLTDLVMRARRLRPVLTSVELARRTLSDGRKQAREITLPFSGSRSCRFSPSCAGSGSSRGNSMIVLGLTGSIGMGKSPFASGPGSLP
jgi:hypothetical protein